MSHRQLWKHVRKYQSDTSSDILDQIYGKPYNAVNGVYNIAAASAVFVGGLIAIGALVEKLF